MTEVSKKRSRPLPEVLPEYARRVKEARGKLSQGAFAAKLGVTPMVISHWENGRNGPSPTMFVKIASNSSGPVRAWFAAMAHAQLFGSQTADAYERLVSERIEPFGKKRPIDVYGTAGAGPFLFVEERKLWEIELPKDWFTNMGEIVGVVITGDSMHPVIESGHIVILDRGRCTPAACLDRIVAVGDGEGVTVKWLRKSGAGYLLVPNNQHADNPIVPVKAHHQIIGCAVRWIAQASYTVVVAGEGDLIEEKPERDKNEG